MTSPALAWDYTSLAAHYDKRADYAPDAVHALLKAVGVRASAMVADIGAGTGKLTSLLLDAGLNVKAIEPNAEMMRFGKQNTAGKNVVWIQATGEYTTLPNACVSLVTFGSSFNVGDRTQTLKEVKRISASGGWFACMWNHRDLEDPTQKKVETIIQHHIANYDYGTRREDQTRFLEDSGFFGPVHSLEGRVLHTISKDDYIEAWKSHGTLARQAGGNFDSIIRDIEQCVSDKPNLRVPYTTRIWYAQLLT